MSKLEYLDFDSKEYTSLSDEEKSLIKKAKTTGQIKNILNCKKHGLQIAVFAKIYDKNGESNYLGCPKCLENSNTSIRGEELDNPVKG